MKERERERERKEFNEQCVQSDRLQNFFSTLSGESKQTEFCNQELTIRPDLTLKYRKKKAAETPT